MEAYVDAINSGEPERLEPILAANVVLQAPPHRDQFPRNVIARLRRELEAFPDLHLEIESAFTDEDGRRGVLVVRWMGRRMRSRVCLLFEIERGRIQTIEPYGGLVKTMYDAGLVQVAS
jgi:hypothetical protein